MKAIDKLKFKKAYKVADWGTEIVAGEAACLPEYIDGWFKKKDEYLFLPNEDEAIFELLNKKNVFFKLEDATEALEKAKKDKRKYYEEQIAQAQEKLKEL